MPSIESINLHPQTHLPSSLKSETYDVICLGSGWAGRIIAARCVSAGMTALVVERELIGGDCPFWACVPSKALLRPAEALDDARHVTGARERLTSPDAVVDAESVFKRRDVFTSGWDDTKVLVPLVESSGAHLVRGVGRITGVKKVNVTLSAGSQKPESIDLEARHAVAICTGSEPIIPDIPGLAEAKPWTPREAASSSVAPETLFIMGGGVVGSEMAAIYQNLGSKVVLASKSPELLPRLDPEAGKIVREKLASRGAHIMTSTSVTAVKRAKPGGPVSISVSSGSDTQEIIATEILVATGRRPITEGLGLESLGLELGTTDPITVDDSLAVTGLPSNNSNSSTPWLYAAGDVNGRATLTHTSKYHGRIAANAILARAQGKFPHQPSPYDSVSASADRAAVPQVIFTDPQVASVGLTRTAARREGRAVRTVSAPAQTLGASLHAEGYEPGWAQFVLDERTGTLLGATFVGSAVADLLHASTVAIVGGMGIDQLVHALPPFPTMSEVYLNLVDAAGL
ncbi:FAD-dependent pyridine nucleotide-disulfide oxidoreductase [Xylariales sp. PMI_506]|nr:FAD-dependent pyridine nucleotide-disulfide oxidoreductase [Xylariales sp. PMI_506]